MKQIWNWIKNNPNRTMFLVPILLVAGISISHVVTWYDMANPINWAIYLSIAIEVGAMTALVAATNKIKGGVWFMFGLVTLIQMIGNIFYSYVQIDPNGDLFKNWVELTGPIWESMGTDLTDTIGLRRWLAFLEGGLLPLISLTSLHFFVKYEKKEDEEVVDNGVEMTDDEIIEMGEKLKLKKVFAKAGEMAANRRNEMGDDEYEKMIEDEPTALANSQYRNEEVIEDEEEWDEDHALDEVMNNMVEDIDKEDANEMGSDLLESLNEEKEETPSDPLEEDKSKIVELPKETTIEVIETPEIKEVSQEIQTKENRVINNQPTNKKMDIDRIR